MIVRSSCKVCESREENDIIRELGRRDFMHHTVPCASGYNVRLASIATPFSTIRNLIFPALVHLNILEHPHVLAYQSLCSTTKDIWDPNGACTSGGGMSS